MSDQANQSSQANALGTFLRARRAALRPEQLGLPVGTSTRRAPGLRREELAALAGVSVDYYIRLERGKDTRPSPAVVNALATVLRLSEEEVDHLHGLVAQSAAGATPAAARPGVSRSVRPGVKQLMEGLRPFPAYVVSRTNDLLAANPAGLRLLAGMESWPARRRNIVRHMFLHPGARRLYVDWEQLAPGTVAHLRAMSAADPDSPELAELVDELMVKSEDFARLWERYEVRSRDAGKKRFHHPSVGSLTLGFEVMHLAHAEGQRLIAFHAVPGSADHDAVVLLDMAMTPAESASVDT
ncbi:helix-turn-helix transcriptional regulator [Streptomyces prunicolor]|jgi:transcriptional regulator with XRE-family HTH domain|uniref:Helix-turn-helix transcriptional regulator n=1 Tax=Streptomyces prunicolor TaxID=67348 RepID=A0ABU4FTX0_9ACTN|nr:helix-turn-helix transcriptional regulator [Streptomyces prunicolor]MDV7224083.1 helix-turn-helix transcriptional regulator [Streptomyces prunicolor]